MHPVHPETHLQDDAAMIQCRRPMKPSSPPLRTRIQTARVDSSPTSLPTPPITPKFEHDSRSHQSRQMGSETNKEKTCTYRAGPNTSVRVSGGVKPSEPLDEVDDRLVTPSSGRAAEH